MAESTFAGRPVVGDFYPGAPVQVEQWDEGQFIELLDAVFAADERVTAVGWRQYTPYFNDGDACVFGAAIAGASLDKVPVRLSGYEQFYDADDEDIQTVSQYSLRPPGQWMWTEDGFRQYVHEVNPDTHPNYRLYKALKNFSAPVERGNFDNVLLDAFGDHATVMALRGEFRVESYEHD